MLRFGGFAVLSLWQPTAKGLLNGRVHLGLLAQQSLMDTSPMALSHLKHGFFCGVFIKAVLILLPLCQV